MPYDQAITITLASKEMTGKSDCFFQNEFSDVFMVNGFFENFTDFASMSVFVIIQQREHEHGYKGVPTVPNIFHGTIGTVEAILALEIVLFWFFVAQFFAQHKFYTKKGTW